VAKQRALSDAQVGLVAEGRDTTTVVFPEADYKFFLIASSTERARRRALQEGRLEDVEQIAADIDRRDRLDTTRAHSPLRQSNDAIVISADDLDAEQVARAILDRVRSQS